MPSTHRYFVLITLAFALFALSLTGACGDDDDNDDSDDDVNDDADDDTDDDADDDMEGDPTWDNFAEGFFTDYCVRCHSDGSELAPMPLATYDDVIDLILLIRLRVVSVKNMPPSTPLPTDEEIATLGHWIDAGGPEN